MRHNTRGGEFACENEKKKLRVSCAFFAARILFFCKCQLSVERVHGNCVKTQSAPYPWRRVYSIAHISCEKRTAAVVKRQNRNSKEKTRLLCHCAVSYKLRSIYRMNGRCPATYIYIFATRFSSQIHRSGNTKKKKNS